MNLTEVPVDTPPTQAPGALVHERCRHLQVFNVPGFNTTNGNTIAMNGDFNSQVTLSGLTSDQVPEITRFGFLR